MRVYLSLAALAALAALTFVVARGEPAPPTLPASSEATPPPALSATSSIGPAAAPSLAIGPAAPEPPPARNPGRVAAELHLLVRAVDHAGQPVAGATLWADVERQQGDGSTSSGTQQLPPTAADGTTQLPDATAQLTPPDVVAVTLVARVSGADGPAVRLDTKALPVECIDVEVPAWGRIVAEVRDPQGALWDVFGSSETFVLTALDAGGKPENRSFLANAARGRIEYEQVAVGRRFRLTHEGELLADAEFAGPDRHGATVTITLRAPTKLRLVSGRLRDVDGTPWQRHTRIALEAPGRRSGGDLRLAADGAFLLRVPEFVGPRPLFRFEHSWRDTTREGVVIVTDDLLPGLHRLGDITMGEPPVLVAGQLVWTMAAPEGATLAEVDLIVEQTTAASSGHGPELTHVRAAADGRFVVRRHAGTSDHRLVLSGPIAPHEVVPFTPGSGDLRILVTPQSRVVASFLVGSGTAGDGWQVTLTPLPGTPEPEKPRPGPGGPGFYTRDVPVREGDRLRTSFSGLAAGSYWLRAARGNAVPAVILRVDVPAGVTLEDARLRDIDLRDR